MVDVPFVLRSATPKDAPRLHELHTASVRTLCSAHYASEVIDGWLVDRTPASYLRPIERGALFVAQGDEWIGGFGEAAPGIVVAVYVDPSIVGRGVGAMILAHAVSLARQDHRGPIRLESTLNARSFYARHGFVEIERSAVRRGHVDIPVVVMERSD
jgi:putative acetyltransferase